MLRREAHPDCWPEGYLKHSCTFFHLGSLNSLFHRAIACDVCKALCEVVQERIDADELIELRSYQRYYHCNLVWDDGAAKQKTGVYRLSITLWYVNDNGNKMWNHISSLRNLFQPAAWPVPQLDSADVHSRFWKSLQSGRLRSPVCENGLLRTWLQNCESSHSMCWWTGPKLSFHLRLFDVTFQCVRSFQVSLDNTVRYVTLSYVWGSQAQRLTLTRTNHNVLNKKGAIELDDLSRTIRDAAVVVQMLGERYLWVDALCIVQDDQNDLAVRLPLMGQIYARSLVTIVAAASTDANSGLPGINSQARSKQRILGPLKGGALLSSCGPKFRKQLRDTKYKEEWRYLAHSKWDTRGWTFQEKVLSRRCLFFMEEQVYWECQCASWCEDTCLEASPERHLRWDGPDVRFFSETDFPAGKQMVGEDVIWALSRLIEEYTSRALTFEKDAYRAFSGLVQILEDLTGARFLQGIYVSTFSRSLHWHDEGSSTLRSGDEFPSWSWLAWTGRISLTSQGPQNQIAQIECYCARSDENGEISLVPISHHIRQKNSLYVVGAHDLAINVRSKLRNDFHIVFWAEAAFLSVPHGDHNLYHIDPELNPPREKYRRIGFMYSERKRRTGVQEFILVRIEAYNEFADDEHPRQVDLLMISWHDGIARREGIGSFDAHEWTRAKPRRKLIVMG